MKKGIVLGLASLFVLTGCGDKVTCTSETVEGGKKVTMKMVGTFKKDKLTETEMIAEFSDKDTAKKACDEAKKSDKNVKCSGKKISQTTKVSKDDQATSKEDFKKLAEGFMGLKCE